MSENPDLENLDDRLGAARADYARLKYDGNLADDVHQSVTEPRRKKWGSRFDSADRGSWIAVAAAVLLAVGLNYLLPQHEPIQRPLATNAKTIISTGKLNFTIPVPPHGVAFRRVPRLVFGVPSLSLPPMPATPIVPTLFISPGLFVSPGNTNADPTSPRSFYA